MSLTIIGFLTRVLQMFEYARSLPWHQKSIVSGSFVAALQNKYSNVIVASSPVSDPLEAFSSSLLFLGTP